MMLACVGAGSAGSLRHATVFRLSWVARRRREGARLTGAVQAPALGEVADVVAAVQAHRPRRQSAAPQCTAHTRPACMR